MNAAFTSISFPYPDVRMSTFELLVANYGNKALGYLSDHAPKLKLGTSLYNPLDFAIKPKIVPFSTISQQGIDK